MLNHYNAPSIVIASTPEELGPGDLPAEAIDRQDDPGRGGIGLHLNHGHHGRREAAGPSVEI